MKIRYFVMALAGALILGIVAAMFLVPAQEYKPNLSQLNDVTATLAADFDRLTNTDYELPACDYDYAVLDAEGRLLCATTEGLATDVYSALKRSDMILDIVRSGQLLGKVIFASNLETHWLAYRGSMQLLVVGILVVMALVYAVFLLYLYKRLLSPFKNMKSFAQRVAAGELDVPLEMDERNVFGAFTESFDMMREELKRARINEQAAEQSKRELVASLSHDIQTPVASIKAVAEVMELTAEAGDVQKLKSIEAKASQIQQLVTELFHTTLEELDSLNVLTVGLASNEIYRMIEASDYQGRVILEELPGCLVLADPVRLAQVMDNIIANSYKYAGTTIWVAGELDGEGLSLCLRDEGPGVQDEELPLLCSKYFRGSSAAAKDGYGLGLYIAHHLIERMGGNLECYNAHPGFSVRLWLKLDA